jgi:putative membrane protein (TIGR04086 family)
MSLLRSILAVVVGYLVSVFVLICLTLFTVVLIDIQPESLKIGLVVLASILSSTASAYLTARMARRKPIVMGLILGVVTVILNAYVFDITYDSDMPDIYNLMISLAAFPGCLVGGYLRYRAVKDLDPISDLPGSLVD